VQLSKLDAHHREAGIRWLRWDPTGSGGIWWDLGSNGYQYWSLLVATGRYWWVLVVDFVDFVDFVDVVWISVFRFDTWD